MDAVHLACAEIFDCDFFVTWDDKLIKKANSLNLKHQDYFLVETPLVNITSPYL